MDKREVLDYLNEYSEFNPKVISRDLAVPMDSDFIISLIGPRRAGKTYYLFQIFKELDNPVYLNFEDSRLRDITYKEIRDVIRVYAELHGKEPKTLLLDEVQVIEGWSIAARELHDLKKYRIFITGSSSKMLSAEIATQLRGRTLSYLLLPFSFKEFLRIRGMDAKNATKDKEAMIKNALLEYMEFGGFPEVVLGTEKQKILKEYSDLILFKDFIERHEIRNIPLARYIHESILQNFSKEVSSNAIFNKAKAAGISISNNTVYDYLEKLNDTVMFFFLDRYSKKVHERASWPKKVYLADTGLSKAIRFSEDKGKLMENVVALELMRKKDYDPNLEIYYIKNENGEVDFVLKSGASISALMQVSAEMNDENYSREMGPMVAASEQLSCNNMSIVTWDHESVEEYKGKKINTVPLWKWLLGIWQ
jgi:hypothetical protein